MIVMKFGGTSVQNADAMQQVIAIVAERKGRTPLVVASACAGVTNQLVELEELALTQRRKDIASSIAALRVRHHDICKDLISQQEQQTSVHSNIDELCDELERLCEGITLLKECTPRSRAILLSFGERLSNEILSAGFISAGHNAVLVDARSVLRTDSIFEQATAQMRDVTSLAEQYFLPHLRVGNIVCTQGFIGSNSKGQTTVLGRGGSDLSAAIFGAALHAEEIQIWTDVSGVFTADPRVAPDARTVPEMSFEEAGELAYFGAKVLHPDTVRPAVEKCIPVRVLNTFKPENIGTLLTPNVDQTSLGIRSVTMKKGCVLLRFRFKPMVEKMAALERIYVTLFKYAIQVFSSEGAERHYSIVVAQSSVLSAVIADIQSVAECSHTQVSIVCAAGANLVVHAYTPDKTLLPQIAAAIQPFGAYSVQQSANSMALLIVLPETASNEAVRAIHSLIV